jgi:hypothetical protein
MRKVNKKEMLSHLIEVYETALVKTKKSNKEVTFNYLQRNHLHDGICYYIKFNKVITFNNKRTKGSIFKIIEKNKAPNRSYWCDCPFVYFYGNDDKCRKKYIKETLKYRLNILKKEYKKCR